MSDRTGKCLCGAVTFVARGLDTEIHACHCEMCRRWTGGPGFATRADAVEFSGEDKIRVFDSSDWAERGFCADCGTHLFYRMKADGLTMLWSGALDDVSDLKLTGEIYVDSKPPGYDFEGDHPRQTGAEFLASIGMGAPES